MAWLLRFSRYSARLCRPESEEQTGAFAVDDSRAGPADCRDSAEDEDESGEEDGDGEVLCPDDLVHPFVGWSTQGSEVWPQHPKAAVLPCHSAK